MRTAAASVGAVRNPGGIAQRMLLASVALALVVGAGFAILLVPIQGARNAERSALHSQDVLIVAHGLEQRVLDLETGRRGWVTTRHPRRWFRWRRLRPRGSGLVGLKDRVEAVGGWMTVQSEPATGTSLEAELPLAESVGASH